MRAVDRTLSLFVKSIAEALPAASIQVVRSANAWGHSRYVYIRSCDRVSKVRISDHAVGMRRALSGECQLYITAGAKPASWAVWLGELVRAQSEPGQSAGRYPSR